MEVMKINNQLLSSIGATIDQIEPTIAPITANEIIPAAGMVDADKPKCLLAST